MYDAAEARNLEAVRSGFDAWANGTGSPLVAISDDVIWEVVGNSVASRVYHGKQDFLSNIIRQFNARLSVPLKPTIRDIFADGDTVIVFFDGEATALDGVPYRNTYTWYLTFADDRIVKGIAFFDSIVFDELWRRVSV